MPIPPYRAKQSTETTGSGTIVLNAAGTNARNFSAAYGASSRRVMYAISWAFGFEIGYGDFDGGTPGNLTRATVVASSNAGALVALPGGTKDVFAVFDPGAREVLPISGTTTLALADMGNAVVFAGASAATLNLPAISTVPLGAGWTVRNAGTAALTIDPSGAETINGAATLVLQVGQAAFIFDGGAAWECIIAGGTATGLSLIAAADAAAARGALSAGVQLGTSVASTSGSSIDFTGIPAGVRRVTAMFSGLSTNGTLNPGVRLGTSGGFATTGYDGAQTLIDSTTIAGTAALSAFGGFALGGALAANIRHGKAEFVRLTGNTWAGALISALSSSGTIAHAAGTITLAGELDRLRFTTGGADAFDAGTINVSWEF